MKKFGWLTKAIASIALGAACAASQATLISTATNNPLAFSWSVNTADGLLTGNGTIAVSGFNTSSLSLLISLSNTSADSTDRLTAFGFGIDPNATGVSFSDSADGGMVNASLASIPSLAAIEVCAWGGQNCAGGANGGILGGGSDEFTIALTTGTGLWGSSVDIAPLGFKYQTSGTSYEFTSVCFSDCEIPPPTVPEPGSLALLGLGFAGLGLFRRRRPH